MNNNEFTPPPMSYQLGGNFDPNSVDQERVVLLGLVIDRSGSTSTYEREFNEKLQEFLREEQKSHIADELFFQLTTFGSDVTIDSGWQPVVGFGGQWCHDVGWRGVALFPCGGWPGRRPGNGFDAGRYRPTVAGFGGGKYGRRFCPHDLGW